MADDQNSPRVNPADRSAPGSGQANDPLAELARLIGQNDPFSEFGRDARGAGSPQQARPLPDAPTVPQHGPAAFPHQPHPPQQELPAFIHAPQESSAYRDAVYRDTGQMPTADYYDEAEERGPSRKFLTATAVIVLALIGTVAAFGYRFIFSGSGSSAPPPIIRANTEPAKVAPPAASEAPSKSTYDRVGDRGEGPRIISREETPVDVRDVTRPGAGRSPPPPQSPVSQWNTAAAPNLPPTGSAPAAAAVMSEPKKVRTVTIRPSADANSPPSSLAPPTAAPPAPSQRAAPVQQQTQQQTQQQAAQRVPAAAAQSAPPAIQQSAPTQQAQRQVQQRVPPPATQSSAPPSGNAPLSLNDDSVLTLPRSLNEPRVAPAPRQAVVQRQPPPPKSETPPAPPQALAQAAAKGGYLVQLSSQRSEAEAQAALRALQAKYPNLLGGQPSTVRRAELGERGVFYRAMIGPYGTREQATQLCSSLKAAGGDCIVHGN